MTPSELQDELAKCRELLKTTQQDAALWRARAQILQSWKDEAQKRIAALLVEIEAKTKEVQQLTGKFSAFHESVRVVFEEHHP